MKRAIVVYLEDKQFLINQFFRLYTSLKFIRANDTDILVFGTKEVLPKLPEDCLKIECNTVDGPPEVKNYLYLNSIHFFSDPKVSNILKDYDYILRSDADTFLTPAWNHYFPEKYTVGHGAYAFSEEVRRNLKRVAAQLGLNHRGIYNIGSTHYGKPEDVIKVHKEAFSISKFLLTEEFKDHEGRWPDWYRGVTLLYSCDIAMNHYIQDFNIDVVNIDYPSTAKDYIYEHVHIHCWHTDGLFSKFKIEEGAYDHYRQEDLDFNRIHEYCLYIALKAREIQFE